MSRRRLRSGPAAATITPASVRPAGSPWEVLAVATRLGLTSFGGPVAHLGYFRSEYVERRRWLDEARYADLIALCQLLPGPASSELGIAIGILRAGLLGGLAAWLGFTLPSAVALALFAALVHGIDVAHAPWLHGLAIVAVAVVANAVWGMARSLAPDRPRATIALLAAIVALLWPVPLAQIAIIVAGGAAGVALLGGAIASPSGGGESASERSESGSARGEGAALAAEAAAPVPIDRRLAVATWVIYAALLIALPSASGSFHGARSLAVAAGFYWAGALVFGGGHVVLPLLQSVVVPTGWVTNAEFLAGYGAAQAVPGPLFTFAAYLGWMIHGGPNGPAGAALALVAIFVPSFLLVIGALPFWEALRRRPALRAALAGVNAAVVGILLAALYHPVWTSAIHAPVDVAIALVAFGLLVVWRLPPWLVVIVTALCGGAAAVAGVRG